MGAIHGVVLFGGLSLAYLISIYLFIKVFARFYDRDGTESSLSATPSRSFDSSPDGRNTHPSASAASSTTVVCLACGAENGREYTFCGNCVARLRTGHAGRPTDPAGK